MPDGGFHNDPTALRLRIFANGWTPVPITAPDYKHEKVVSPGKAPFMKGWQKLRPDTLTEGMIRNWTRIWNQPGTGIIAGINGLVAPDIDVTTPELARLISDKAEAILGRTPFTRFGKPPKMLLLYRVPGEVKKLMTPMLFGPSGDSARVEVLAAGQQFVAYGMPILRRLVAGLALEPEAND